MKNKMYGFSIIVTERCNLNCTYCHFFDHVSRMSGRDMSDEQLDSYFQFIKYFKDNMKQYTVNFRFSGGDPIVLGDRLFEIADRGYEITKIEPFFLTAGKGIDEKWIKKARKSKMAASMISIENPLNPDKGAMNPYEIMRKMKKYSSEEFRLLPGVTVVKNEDFKNIYEISTIIYEELGILPKIQEINFDSFISPTDEELEDLYNNLYKVLTKFRGKTYFDYFMYISPEFSATHHEKEVYLSELNFDNKHRIGEVSNENAMKSILDYIDINYPQHKCGEKECDWFEQCKRIKWIWKQESRTVTKEQKIKDYCRMKKIINQAYYDALVK